MSTKVYDGLRLTAHAPDLFTLTRIISKRMREVFYELATEVISGWVTRIVDEPTERGDEPKMMLLDRGQELWLAQQNKINPHLRGHDPLRFQIVFSEVSDDLGTRRLAYTFCDHPAYREALFGFSNEFGKPYFVDYHYQNSTEGPEEISEEEWSMRRRDWNAVLDSDDPETNGTFGHLPGWSLPDTIREVFGTWLWMRKSIDLNQHISPERRRRMMLQRDAWRQLGTPDSSDFGAILRTERRLKQAVTDVLARPEHADAPLPDPLPSSLLVAVGELPVFMPEEQLVADVVARFHELSAAESTGD